MRLEEKGKIRLALFTAAWWKLDGVTLTLRKLVSELRRHSEEISVRIYTTDASIRRHELRQEEFCIADSIDVPFWSSTQGYKMGSPMSSRVRKDLKHFNPNVIHVSVPDLLGRDAMYYGKRNNIPVISTYHSNYYEYMYKVFPYPFNSFIGECCRLYLVNIYTQIETTYVPTLFTKKKLERDGFVIDGVNTLKVWGREVDTTVFAPLCEQQVLKFRRLHGISPNAVVILWVGRVVKEKAIHIWLRCVKRLKRQFPEIFGIVVGSGTELEIFKPYSSFIRCMGWIEEPEKLSIVFAMSDIMFFPSSVETFGNVTLEAMACGLPVVVDKHCSGHLVVHGKSGFGVESLDEDSYCDALCTLICDPKLRESFGQVGRIRALSLRRNQGDVMLCNYMSEMSKMKKKRKKNKSRGLCWYGFDMFVFVCTVIFFSSWGFVHFLINHMTRMVKENTSLPPSSSTLKHVVLNKKNVFCVEMKGSE
jgi:phosphatidylinositol alpha 1,6-mannosyltransferase